MPRARQKAAGSIPAAAAAGQAAASRSSVDATTYDWARSAAQAKESRLGPQLSYEAKLMQGFVRAGRQGNLPLERLSVNDARLMAQADLSPADMHFVHKGIMNRGLESPDFESQLTGDEARVFGRIKNGGSSLHKANIGLISPFGNLIAQGEGRESTEDGIDVIKLGRHTTLDEFNGKPQDKTYEPYLDKAGLLNIGPGVRLFDGPDSRAELGALHLSSAQVKGGKTANINGSDIAYLTGAQMEKLFQMRARKAAAEVKATLPCVDFLGDYQQAVAVSMAYNMGQGSAASGRGFKSFTKFIEYTEDGDFYNAGLEMLRSKRSSDVKGRNLWEALIFLTNGDPNLTGEGKLNDYKDKVTEALKDKNNEGKSIAQVLEELYVSEAARLGYRPKDE